MNEKILVNKSDYEIYTVHLPLSVILKGKRKNYIYSELEKQHPCFSEDWSFDSKMKIGKSGFDSEVLVINKMKLAEYKIQNGYGRLSFQSDVDGKTFSRSFKDSSKFYWLGLVLVFVVILAVLNGLLKVNNKIDSNFIEEKESGLLHVYGERKESVNDFLNYMEIAGGRMNSLSWYSDGYKEYFEANVTGVYPDDVFLEETLCSVISFVEMKPNFFVKMEDWIVSEKVHRNESVEKKDFLQNVRNCMSAYSVMPLEENQNKLSFKFSCGEYTELSNSNFFISLSEISLSNGYEIESIRLNRIPGSKSADGFSGEICFKENSNGFIGVDLEKFGWRTNLLLTKNQLKTNPVTSTGKMNYPSPGKKNVTGQKIGEIKHSDGTTSVFYRDSKGKIVCVN